MNSVDDLLDAEDELRIPWRGRASQIVAGKKNDPISSGQKKWQLLRLLGTNPREFYDRMRAIVEMKAQKRWPTTVRYTAEPWADVVDKINATLHPDIAWSDGDAGFVETCRALEARLSSMRNVPFPPAFDGDLVLSRLCYFLTLALKPTLVVESGVALGVVSSFILAAMERNGHGQFLSVDLPPLCIANDMTGALIPDSLRHRWTLHRGTTVRVLPKVLESLPPVDLFIHDSLFTRRNSRQEYSIVLPRLSNRAAIVSNRINPTDAFAWLRDTSNPAMSAVAAAKTKDEFVGLNVYVKGGSEKPGD